MKDLVTPEQILIKLNLAMAESEALDGDCKNCQVRHVGRVTQDEAKHLHRNWNVDMVNGECGGDCMGVLEDVARAIGEKFDAVWP